jgi:hypothetical protein
MYIQKKKSKKNNTKKNPLFFNLIFLTHQTQTPVTSTSSHAHIGIGEIIAI